jgi:hypothetical protein
MTDAQATKCAACGEVKPTPLRRDEMGGYICLSCIDANLTAQSDRIKELEGALAPFASDPMGVGELIWGGMPDDAGGTITIRLGDIRRASRALNTSPPTRKENEGNRT